MEKQPEVKCRLRQTSKTNTSQDFWSIMKNQDTFEHAVGYMH